MGNYEGLKAAVVAVIKQNGNEEIAGQIMQNTLLSMISNIGANSTFAGVATPETAPGTPDQNVFYLAGTPGVYANFGGYELKQGIVIFTNASGSFTAVDLGINNNDVMMKFLPDKSIIGIPNVDYNHICNITLDGAFAGYIENANYDAAWINLLDGVIQLNVLGAIPTRFNYFSTMEPTTDNYISNNTTGVIPDNAVLCIINMSHNNNPNGYENIKVGIRNFFWSSSA